MVERILNGDTRAVARAISWIENEHPEKEQLIDALYPHAGQAAVWGITGPPGSGKSSLVNLIIKIERAKGKKVAVIAVDPSSPFSGGAILGDRIRMQNHATDAGVFIRSMASRGHLGGIAGATADAIKVLDAAGFDLILIETIGVGQTEIDIVGLSDLVLLVLVPGLGDEIQALKAGVMEIGDVFIVNKSDKADADRVKAEVEYVLHLKDDYDPQNQNPVFMTSALQNEGVEEMTAGVEEYFAKLSHNGKLEEKRKKRIAGELRNIIHSKLRERIYRYFDLDRALMDWVEQIFRKQTTPYALVNRELEQFFRETVLK